MKYLLDTNVCIKYLNGDSDLVKEQILKYRYENIVLCSIVKAELIFGAYRSANPEKNLKKLEMFFKPFQSFSFDDKASFFYGVIRSDLSKKGAIIGPNDLFIASIALSNQLTLVTHNTSEFSRVKKLETEDWEE